MKGTSADNRRVLLLCAPSDRQCQVADGDLGMQSERGGSGLLLRRGMRGVRRSYSVLLGCVSSGDVPVFAAG